MRPITKGSTDQSVIVRVIDSTDGTPETSVAYNTAGVDLWYRREGGLKVSITEATLAAADSTHSDGGFIHISDGYCRLDLPDAAVATGANGVMVGGTFTGMIVIGCYIPLVDYNPYDAVRMGMTALPDAAADAAGGLPISDAGGLDLDTTLANDPLLNIVPGAYVSGTAGYALGHMTSMGAGAITWTYTLTDSVTGAPIDGAEVWVTSDSAGAFIIASGTTNEYGIVTFYLDAGTVYIWRKRAGYNFVNPDSEIVS